jgi:hypothetical protein
MLASGSGQGGERCRTGGKEIAPKGDKLGSAEEGVGDRFAKIGSWLTAEKEK